MQSEPCGCRYVCAYECLQEQIDGLTGAPLCSHTVLRCSTCFTWLLKGFCLPSCLFATSFFLSAYSSLCTLLAQPSLQLVIVFIVRFPLCTFIIKDFKYSALQNNGERLYSWKVKQWESEHSAACQRILVVVIHNWPNAKAHLTMLLTSPSIATVDIQLFKKQTKKKKQVYGIWSKSFVWFCVTQLNGNCQ